MTIAVTVEQILSTCGSGKILELACGNGGLVQALVAQGVDAFGIDCDLHSTELAKRHLSGRLTSGTLGNLPFADKSFDTILTLTALDGLTDHQVPSIFAECWRVTRRFAFFRVTTRNGRDRRWWETHAFVAGFRKHPLFFDVNPYESLEHETGTILLLLEKLPDDAGQCFPLAQLQDERELHMDMLREAGRRSDAHCVRYAFAQQYVRPKDTVVDAACGLGYGSAILWAGTQAARVIGIDNSPAAIRYAKGCYAPARDHLEFVEADVTELSFIESESVGTVVSFETVEHVSDPAAFLTEVQRILIPGGRFICSVPNLWVDERGKDVGEYHLHSYDYHKIKQLCARYFLVEQVFAQNAGGGYKYPDQGRSLREVDLECDNAGVEAEWWVVIGMKNPLLGSRQNFIERIYPVAAGEACAAVSWGRDYENPWVYHALVNRAFRVRAPRLLKQLCRELFDRSSSLSPDAGAALCVLGYQALEDGVDNRESREWLEQSLTAYVQGVEARKQASSGTECCPLNSFRWAISNRFLLAKLREQSGELREARELYWQCANMPFEQFSPLIATKTVAAAFQAGWLAMNAGDHAGARTAWCLGVETSRKALSADWKEFYGNIEDPFDFGLTEAEQILDVARKCANGLHHMPMVTARPGRVAISIPEAQEERFSRLSRNARLRETALQQELSTLQQDLSNILSTRSWKITAPLRKLLLHVNRIFNHLY